MIHSGSGSRKRLHSSISEEYDIPGSPASSIGSLEAEVELRLASATMAAATTGSLTPILKEEIRAAIQYKRLQRGEDELVVEYKQVEKQEVMSHEESKKRSQRRDRNKTAAQKCRTKKRREADSLEKRKEELENSQQKLRQEVDSLEKERENLVHMLTCHQFVCTLPKTGSSTMVSSSSSSLSSSPPTATNSVSSAAGSYVQAASTPITIPRPSHTSQCSSDTSRCSSVRTVSESSGFSEMTYLSESPFGKSDSFSSFFGTTDDSDDSGDNYLLLNIPEFE